MNTTQYLFLFSIGPVQSFIAQARKTQDLYAGSRILSDLLNFALIYAKTSNADILFPYFDKSQYTFDIEQNEDSYPNRFVVLLDMDTEGVKYFGQTIESLVKKQLLEVVKMKINKVINTQDMPLGICEQIQDFLDIYWVALPYKENSDIYADKYKELEKLLGVVKNVRQFRQFAEVGRKCSLNGEYNVKVYRKTFEEENKQKKRQQIRDIKLFAQENFIADNNYKAIKKRHLQAGEGLCAISFLKRLYKDKEDEKQNFPSTAKICLQNLYKEPNLKSLLEQFEKMFDDDCFDEQLLFEENLNQNYFDKFGIILKDTIENIENKQKEVFKVAKDLHKKPSRYYALLRFDGDSMGEWLSKAKDKAEHKNFSKLLIEFAQKAKDYLDTEGGKTVYAGGDDFLGFVNLSYLFETLTHLKDLFEQEVTNQAKRIFKTDKAFTISISVLIGHYKMPLQKAVTYSDTLLKETKQRFKEADNDFDTPKNGIGICYMTSNSVLGTSFFKRKEDLELLKDLTHYFKEGDISPNLLFKYFQSVKTIIGTELSFEGYENQIAILQIELKRLLERSCLKEKRADISKMLLFDNKNETGLASLLRYQVKSNQPNKYVIDTDNFFSFIKIATKIAQEISNAVPTYTTA